MYAITTSDCEKMAMVFQNPVCASRRRAYAPRTSVEVFTGPFWQSAVTKFATHKLFIHIFRTTAASAANRWPQGFEASARFVEGFLPSSEITKSTRFTRPPNNESY
jgi:hypothetical protein